MTKNILIVDDVPNNLHLLTKMLEKYGYDIRPVSSGKRALATIKKQCLI